jgi:hypothetical protein
MVLNQDDIYDFHGLLHVMLYGLILRSSTWSRLFIWLGVVNFLTFLNYCFLYRNALLRSGIASSLLPILLALIPAVLVLGLQGRPEQLAPLLMSLPLLVRELGGTRGLCQSLLPITAALLFLLSPLIGVAYGLTSLVGIAVASRHGLRDGVEWRGVIGGLIAAALGAIFLITLFTPYGPLEWLDNTYNMGGTTYGTSHYFIRLAVYGWGVAQVAPLWNSLTLVLLSIILTTLVIRRRLFVLVIAALFLMRYGSAMNEYSYISFLPLSLLLVIDRGWYQRFVLCRLVPHRAALVSLSIVASVYLLVFMGYATVAIQQASQGPSLSASRAKLQQVIGSPQQAGMWPDPKQAIAYNENSGHSFIPFGDAGAGFIAGNQATEKQNDPDDLLVRYQKIFERKISWYILPQRFPFLKRDLSPIVWVAGAPFKLTYDNWSDHFSTLEKMVRPRNLPDGYRFALYRRCSERGNSKAESASFSLTASPSPRPRRAPDR